MTMTYGRCAYPYSTHSITTCFDLNIGWSGGATQGAINNTPMNFTMNFVFVSILPGIRPVFFAQGSPSRCQSVVVNPA